MPTITIDMPDTHILPIGRNSSTVRLPWIGLLPNGLRSTLR